MEFIFDADEDFLLGGSAREIARFGAMTSTGETESLFAVYGIFGAGFKYGTCPTVITDIFVQSDIDTT